MANYYGSSRTNYFKVKDRAAFEEWAEKYGFEVIENAHGRVGLLAGDANDDSTFNVWDDKLEDNIQLHEHLVPHLADGEVCIVIEIGSEKMRYLNGYAEAFDNKGEYTYIGLHEIYERANKQWPKANITKAEY